LQIVDYIGAN